ncbi:MAG TPA: hypothetical protein ENH30_01495 [Nitrospirae bacterium]|nr:hypothetical protein [Nitrospirota bacterium]
MQFVSNAAIEKEKLEKDKILVEGTIAPEVFFDNLTAHIRTNWEKAKRAKVDIENQMLKMKRRREGVYDPSKLAAIRSVHGADYNPVFMMITETKCRAAESWIKDIEFQPGQLPWDLEPTPLPELPPSIHKFWTENAQESLIQQIVQEAVINSQPITPELIQSRMQEAMPQLEDKINRLIKKQAKKAADKMKEKIKDQFAEGGWEEAFSKCIYDLVTYKAAFLKGPIYRKETVRRRIFDEETGRWMPQIETRIVGKFERRSPFDIYPAPDSNGIDDGYLFDKIALTASSLSKLIGVPGYKESEIRAILDQFRAGGLREWVTIDMERSTLEGKGSLSLFEGNKIDCLEYQGSAQGKWLREWGVKGINDDQKEYDIIAWLIGNHVIKAVLNPDVNGKKNLSKGSFIEDPDAFWGKGVPELIDDIQDILNAIARAVVNNVGIAAGPQIAVNMDRIAPGASVRVWPLKVWKSTNKQMQEGKPVEFWAPPMIVDKLMTAMEQFLKLADEQSGVPRYAHGDTSVGGAGKALADYEKVLTPQGPININLLKKGDLIVNSYGSFSTVTGVFPQGESDIFRMKFSNGEHIDCDINHRWSVKTHQRRKFKTLTTKQILKKGLFRKTKIDDRNPKGYRPKWMIPLIDFIEFEEKKVKIDPYVMGALIGDGDARCRLTSADKDIFDRIPYPLGKSDKRDSKDTAWTCAIKGIRPDYRSYGLKCKSIDKFIPEDYLYNSKEIRLELLRGLMDTDGCCSKEGQTFFSTSSEKLAKDFLKLVRSLGATVNKINETEGGQFIIKGRKSTRKNMYRIIFNLPFKKIFHLERKQTRVKFKSKTYLYITGIEYIGRHPATCISVDSKDNLFICENSIPTHNTASGLSMLMTQAARGIKASIKNIDTGLVVGSVKRQYYMNMEFEDDASIIGDIKIVARGSTSMIAKEQLAVRRNEFLISTANPYDMAILGLPGRATILKANAESLDLGVDMEEIFGDEEELNRKAAMMENNGGNPGDKEKPQKLDAAGATVSGKNTALFMEGK